MRILHSSDLHGCYKKLLAHQDFDIWVDTGDFFPNVSRGYKIEQGFQTCWFTSNVLELREKYKRAVAALHHGQPGWWITDKQNPPGEETIQGQLTRWLNGRPMLSMPGNHDWADLASMMGAPSLINGYVELLGAKWSGFREIPYIAGEWNGETRPEEFREIIARQKAINPDILLTHSPPDKILDRSYYGHNYGIPELTGWLMGPIAHNVQYHLFGHVHECGGVREIIDGTTFVNSATTITTVEV